MRRKARTTLLLTCLFLSFVIFVLCGPAKTKAEAERKPLGRSDWHDLGNGWKVNILSIERTIFLEALVPFNPQRLPPKKWAQTVIPDGMFLIVTILADVEEEAYGKVLLLLTRDSTFLIDNKGEKFSMKGFLSGKTGRMGKIYDPAIIGRGESGSPKEPITRRIFFDVHIKSKGLKLVVMKNTPPIEIYEASPGKSTDSREACEEDCRKMIERGELRQGMTVEECIKTLCK